MKLVLTGTPKTGFLATGHNTTWILSLGCHVAATFGVFVDDDHYKLHVRYNHTGKCICRFGGIYAYCRYLKDRKW